MEFLSKSIFGKGYNRLKDRVGGRNNHDHLKRPGILGGEFSLEHLVLIILVGICGNYLPLIQLMTGVFSSTNPIRNVFMKN